MSIASRYLHTLVVKQVRSTGAVDGYSQLITTEGTLATVRGLIQPRAAREVALASQAGTAIGSHVAYLDPLAGLSTSCWIEKDGIRYDVVSIADAGGVGHHLELGLVQVS